MVIVYIKKSILIALIIRYYKILTEIWDYDIYSIEKLNASSGAFNRIYGSICHYFNWFANRPFRLYIQKI